ncbi:MAG: phage holin family protein [Ruminococcus flavefaciens]|nr:phage holin family protein [Ruminococcus flavefaciens]MCM1232669.1 phage holin family protein [Ruminococcus flavefaciens]
MQYIIMLLIVVGLALADYLTGLIKAYCRNDISSSKMRKGGLNKLSEILVMTVACGLDIGINALGAYYQAVELSEIAGAITAFLVFFYILAMETVSIFENYAEINPEAQWALKIVKRLKNFNDKDKED